MGKAKKRKKRQRGKSQQKEKSQQEQILTRTKKLFFALFNHSPSIVSDILSETMSKVKEDCPGNYTALCVTPSLDTFPIDFQAFCETFHYSSGWENYIKLWTPIRETQIIPILFTSYDIGTTTPPSDIPEEFNYELFLINRPQDKKLQV
ncbi:hypothetical protein [Coleofasciculus sp.]|uniref:hypothetical protein n=1 Tax=Coleofasciculus sp. TaxID=3100458 RepID=UPI0039F8FAC3